MDGGDVVRLILLLLALLLSAFFSFSEAAFLSIQRGRLAYLMRSGVKGADKAAQIAGHPEKLLPTVLTGNNLVNTAAAALGTAVVMSFLKPNIAVIVATVVVTGLLLVFAETIPKTLAAKNAERFAITVVGPLRLAETLFFPAVWVLEKLMHRIGRLFNISNAAMAAEGEIRALIDAGREVGTVEPSEAQMLERVFRFGDRQLREMMTPRTVIVALEKGATLEQFLRVYRENPYTRFPVYESSVDNVLGTVSAKDVLKAMALEEIGQQDDVTHLLRPTYFVPETNVVGKLFEELRGTGHQMVMVVDEFGGIAGLVTLKEMMEQVVGSVGEEGMKEEEFQTIDPHTYQVEGTMWVEEANEQLALGIPEGEYETVAGFILARLGHIPREGEHVHNNDFLLEVVEMRGLKIEQVKVSRVTRPSSGEGL